MNLGPFSKFGKNGVELWIATHSHVLHGSAEGGHGESHQRSIPTNLLHRRYHFEISALTRRLAQLLGKRLYRGVREVLGGRLTLVHHLQNRVDKAIETQQTAEF